MKITVVKRILAVLLMLICVVVLVFLAGRYGWKLGGFKACSTAGIEQIHVEEDCVRIRGFYPGSFPTGFLGYHAEQVEDTLYVGFRFSALFGIFETGDFDITIPVKGTVSRVVAKSGEHEHAVWPKEDFSPDETEATQSSTPEEVIEPVSDNQDISALLGENEPIVLKTEVDEWEFLNVSVESGSSAVELGNFGQLVEAYAVKRADGRSFLIITCDYMSDDYITFVCEVTGGNIRKCSELGSAYLAEEIKTGNLLKMTVVLDVLGTYRARMDYFLDKDGQLVQAQPVFTIDREYPMTVIKELPVTVNGEAGTVAVGTEIMITGTNNIDEVYYQVVDGEENGTIHYTQDEADPWIHFIEGVSEYEYIEGLPYAG